MDFDLSDDQRLLKDSVDRLLQGEYGFEARRTHQSHPGGWSPEIWGRFAELGLLGLPFSEAEGGFGGTTVDVALVMESFGRALVIEPFFASVVLCGGLLRHGASAARRDELLPALIDGSRILAYAQAERHSRYALDVVETTAAPSGDAWSVSGSKSLVLNGDTADTLIVSARTDAGPVRLFRIDTDQPGVQRRAYPTQDGARAAEITLNAARATPLGDGDALPAMQRAEDEAIAALCAEAVGVMQAMHALTLDYLKTRKQFGRPIGDNQVLQHRAVDMYVALEQARSMALYATMMAASEDATERRRAIHAAKVQIGRSGRHIGQEAVQLHGGIGVTMEYVVGHHFKRMTMIERSFGDTDTHLAALARLGGLIPA